MVTPATMKTSMGIIATQFNRLLEKASTFRPAVKEERLFEGDSALFEDVVSRSATYAEYGCGTSTVWVANHTNCSIYSVDSSEVWISRTKSRFKRNENINIYHANLGAVQNWGRPIGYDRHESFPDYTDWIWKQNVSPDTILIDGRFRVCCFLTTLLYAREGARIIFDDYMPRPRYHFIERFLKPEDVCGRQALFVAPRKDSLDADNLIRGIAQFRFVMD